MLSAQLLGAGNRKDRVVKGIKARWLMPAPMPGGYDAPLKHLSSVIAQILFNRGIGPDEIPGFLYPQAASSHAPMLMRGMPEAVRRIRTAIAVGETIAVYGDFDVDGVTGTVLLHQVLNALGAQCQVYIPRRVSEGYGLNVVALEQLRQEGVRLVVTVDCGISSAGEIDHARHLGLDVIVTDHHHPPARLPDAVAILNPCQPLCTYPFKGLAGVGVAFKLATALLDGVPDGHRLRRELLDLVVVGTVSDMVPLRGENRVLVHYGLPLLSQTARPGLRALFRRARLEHARVTTADIGYRIGPRLNAAGRLDHALVGCHLLMTDDVAEAEALADALERKNTERQLLTASTLEQARELIGPAPVDRALVVDQDDWSAGVLGLVAGRLAEEYCRPVCVVERGVIESRGSARSVPGFNIIEALTACQDLLIKYGGHAQAAGFSLHAADIPALRDRLVGMANARLRAEDLVPTIQLDAEIGGREFGRDALQTLHEQLAALEPFGIGNLPPILLWRNLRVSECRVVGANHLRFTLATPQGMVGAIAFGMAEGVAVLPRGSTVDVVFSLQYNDWNGYSVVELRVKDVALKSDVSRTRERHEQASSA